jgi:tetratricopeptide (TPR) repeat protein
LEKVIASSIELPDQLMRKYIPAGPDSVTFRVGITPRVLANVEFGSVGATLLLAEIYQTMGRFDEAIGVIQQLYELNPTDPVLTLSLCDLLYEAGDFDGVLEAAKGVTPTDDVSISIVTLKAKALASQGMSAAALEAVNACLKRTSRIDAELLMEIRYDRATLYETMGKNSLARRDWERLYARDPKYRDVAQRLAE